MLNEILSIFTIFLYTVLGTYVLSKNPHDRTNKFFAILMFVFMVWSSTAYTTGISMEGLPYFIPRIQQSASVISIAFFILIAISPSIEKALRDPITYLILFPGLYLLIIIWTSDISAFGPIPLNADFSIGKELFLFSSIFAVAGIYLILRLYGASRYREREGTKLMIAGSIIAISAVILSSIILPLFFDIYSLTLSILAPSISGIFFSFSVYSHGRSIIPVPELSVTSFCGAECTICPAYIEKRCSGCRFDMTMYGKCSAYICSTEKGYAGCTECPEIISCAKRNENIICFSSKPAYQLKPGSMYVANEKASGIFLDAVMHGAFGIIASTTNPYIIKERYGLVTTPMIWISEEGGESDVRPNDLKRLGMLLTNFMIKINDLGRSIILLDGSSTLVRVNGPEKFEHFIGMLYTAAASAGGIVIFKIDHDDEKTRLILKGIKNIENIDL